MLSMPVVVQLLLPVPVYRLALGADAGLALYVDSWSPMIAATLAYIFNFFLWHEHHLFSSNILLKRYIKLSA